MSAAASCQVSAEPTAVPFKYTVLRFIVVAQPAVLNCCGEASSLRSSR